MRCPVDEETLLMTTREGIEIDYCPRCRGVWLDRGELDKIVERSGEGETPRPERREPPRDRYPSKEHQAYRRKSKRKNFIEELFDFG